MLTLQFKCNIICIKEVNYMNNSHGQKTRFTLKACRVNKGLTIKEAAKKLGLSEFTLMNYELGKTFPTVPVINKIEELYDVSYNDIIFLP